MARLSKLDNELYSKKTQRYPVQLNRDNFKKLERLKIVFNVKSNNEVIDILFDKYIQNESDDNIILYNKLKEVIN